MGRPREFDIDEALTRAMDVFWAKGYEGASLHDLLAAMSIARGSLYKAFHDKRGIYLAALDYYDRTVVEENVRRLGNTKAGDGAERVRRFLNSARELVADDPERRGCFMCNAAIDQASLDPEIQGRVMAMMKRLEQAIGAALRQSRTARAWPVKRRAEAARQILSSYMGLTVLAKSGYGAAALGPVAAASLRGCGL
jgi:TetR/AcrR family transcriptional regulator, transcriptional repressor for nem operon